MTITDDDLRKCMSAGDVQPLLRAEFRAGNYEDVYDAIHRYYNLAQINRSHARAYLFRQLVGFTSNYVIAPNFRTRDMLDWEAEFPALLQQLGEQREDSWQEFLMDRATWRREGLRDAIEVITSTIERFNAI